MTRLEKIELAIKKGITCNPETGEVFGVKGNVINKNHIGYIVIHMTHNKKSYNILAHQFIWYWVNKEIVESIDHIDLNRKNNKINNLRSVTHQQNNFNNTGKGYYFNNKLNKYQSQISINYETKYLGRFNTEQEARQAYLDAKKIYHII
jgi:hypothetical protein